jgi:hypothetical protein
MGAMAFNLVQRSEVAYRILTLKNEQVEGITYLSGSIGPLRGVDAESRAGYQNQVAKFVLPALIWRELLPTSH